MAWLFWYRLLFGRGEEGRKTCRHAVWMKKKKKRTCDCAGMCKLGALVTLLIQSHSKDDLCINSWTEIPSKQNKPHMPPIRLEKLQRHRFLTFKNGAQAPHLKVTEPVYWHVAVTTRILHSLRHRCQPPKAGSVDAKNPWEELLRTGFHSTDGMN